MGFVLSVLLMYVFPSIDLFPDGQMSFLHVPQNKVVVKGNVTLEELLEIMYKTLLLMFRNASRNVKTSCVKA